MYNIVCGLVHTGLYVENVPSKVAPSNCTEKAPQVGHTSPKTSIAFPVNVSSTVALAAEETLREYASDRILGCQDRRTGHYSR